MARINWQDLTDARTLDAGELADTRGGWMMLFRPPPPVTSPWGFMLNNPFGRFTQPGLWGMSNAWAWGVHNHDVNHNAFISRLRS